MIFFLISLTIICLFILSKRKWTKQVIADYYGITKKTLNKWVLHIPSNINYMEYTQARILSVWQAVAIFNAFGFVEDQKPLKKAEILSICEINYRTLRENISTLYCGVSLETYKKLNVFPPIISGKIINHLGY